MYDEASSKRDREMDRNSQKRISLTVTILATIIDCRTALAAIGIAIRVI
jgi:hypothetical protein